MVELLEGTPDLDAVFAANDVMADAALAVLRRAGRAVPSDVSVAGFDDSSVAELATPPLTTVHQHFDVISAELVRVLLEVVEGEVPRSVVIPTTLVVRESA
jgi:DNA-binding LacI/PurR family transcriptional regulator